MQSLSSIPDAAKRQMTYAYDDQGRRIYARTMEWNTNNDSYTLIAEERYWYDGWNLIGRGDSATELAQKFVWGLDLSGAMQGAGGVGGLLMLDDSQGKSYFYGFDGNGNVLMLANANDGTTAAQYDYGPFGEVIRSTGPMAKANPFRFSTKYQDDESDLLYYGSRYYNASAGKWLSRDLIEEKGGYNVYSFVLNNPQEYYDKIGFAPQEGAPSLAIVQPIWTDDECGAFQLEINWSIFPPSKDGGYIVQSVQMRALEYNCEEPEKLVHSDKFRYDEAWKVYKAQSANNLQQPNQIELTGLDYFQHRPSTSHSRGLVIFKATARFEEGMTLLGMGSIWKRYNPNTVAQSLFSTTQVPGPMWPADPLNPFANQAISKPVSRRLVYAWDCCCKKTRPYVESSDVNVAREIEIVENLMQENDPDTPEGVQRQEEDNWERSLVE
ncbi:MAG TPA: RHS repeat-associated core domain-containing protein [Verrucomicrobiae bacterium]|nr:RHS repeat-associated core domain-containing protein [Verrucomicrobiae bacterium]